VLRLRFPTRTRLEGIEDRDAGRLEIRNVTGHDREAVLERCGGNSKVKPLVADR
jgi:hypothetical protein